MVAVKFAMRGHLYTEPRYSTPGICATRSQGARAARTPRKIVTRAVINAISKGSMDQDGENGAGNMNAEQLLTEENVAQVLNIHVSTLRKWRRNGRPKIPYYQDGRWIRYDPKDIEKYLSKILVKEKNT